MKFSNKINTTVKIRRQSTVILLIELFVKFRRKWGGAGGMKKVFKLQHLLNMELVFVFYVIKFV